MAFVARKRLLPAAASTEQDRISQLPESLLHHILSFLNALNAVQTCILSKSWRYVWTSLPNLDFTLHNRMFHHPLHVKSKTFNLQNFVNQFLLRRSSCSIVKFRFFCSSVVDSNLVESLINYAIRHNVQELCFNAYCSDPIQFPNCFSGSKFLSVLELNSDMGLPKSFDLPFLKVLRLSGFVGSNGNFDGKIFSTCPKLEILKLEDMVFDDCQPFVIDALNLKTLEIMCGPDQRSHSLDGTEIVISAPKLAKFKFDGWIPLVFSTENLDSLEEVDFHLHPRIDGEDVDYVDKIGKDFSIYLIKMFDEFNNAKYIKLTMETLEVLSKSHALLRERSSPFLSLKCLKLKSRDGYNRDIILDPYIFNYFLRRLAFLILC